ncbi:hypothetical protein [Parapedobacter koreensis]|uniref:DUF4369 domain-containing protein n=1 Tax=Parapedobacter koreensis TaxID=332977 RepID=A0A1H7UNZ6_9SPHI|nr:hypothetical protein [Parapedobacter koreensis]SEL98681.1 hypothetical protein SAMN05421740_1208 [Parapedobacter koreensis]
MVKTITAILFFFASTAWCLAQNTFPSSGNVGIGVSPQDKLHVKGDVRFERLTGGSNFLRIHSDANGSYLTSDDPGTNHKHLTLQVVSPNSESGARHLYFKTGVKGGSMSTRMLIHHNGNVGIGTTSPKAKLAVEGTVLAKEVKVKTDIAVPDYVFEPGYELTTLVDVEAYVKEHKHLPEIPSAEDIEKGGLDLAEMNLLLLKKVEELTLHLIAKEKSEQELKQYLHRLDAENSSFRSQLQVLNDEIRKLK